MKLQKFTSVVGALGFLLMTTLASASGGGVSGGGNADPSACLSAFQHLPEFNAETATSTEFRDFLINSECDYDFDYASCVSEAIVDFKMEVTSVKSHCGRAI